MTLRPFDKWRMDKEQLERPHHPTVGATQEPSEETMIEKKAPPNDATSAPTAPDPQDPLNVPMDQVVTEAPKIDGSHTQETIVPAERLPEDPEEQNDLA